MNQNARAVKEILNGHGFVRIVTAVLIADKQHPHGHTRCAEGGGIVRGRAADVQYSDSLSVSGGLQSSGYGRVDPPDGGARDVLFNNAGIALAVPDQLEPRAAARCHR